jgi:hypothetical protein
MAKQAGTIRLTETVFETAGLTKGVLVDVQYFDMGLAYVKGDRPRPGAHDGLWAIPSTSFKESK